MHFLLGPEIQWLLFYLVVTLTIKPIVTQPKAVDYFMQTCWFWVPLFVLLSFALWWFPMVEKDWLLLRVWVAGILGGHFVLEKTISMNQTQNSGTGMGYLAGMLFLIVFLIGGSVVLAVKAFLG